MQDAANRRLQTVVRDAEVVDVGEEALGLLIDEVVEPLAAALLHGLEAHLDVDGQLLAQLLVGLDDPEPADDGSLVVGAAAAPQHAVDLGQHKGLRVPAVTLRRKVFRVEDKTMLATFSAGCTSR